MLQPGGSGTGIVSQPPPRFVAMARSNLLSAASKQKFAMIGAWVGGGGVLQAAVKLSTSKEDPFTTAQVLLVAFLGSTLSFVGLRSAPRQARRCCQT